MLRRLAFMIGFGGVVVALLVAGVLDLMLGEDVLMIAPHERSVVELNRALYSPGDPVPEIYGNPLSDPVRVVLPDASRLKRPAEDRSLLLLEVEKNRGENPLQTQTVWFFARFVMGGLALCGVAGFILPRRRQPA